MQNHKFITNYVADWLKRADEDTQAAEVLLTDGGLSNSVCFHSQQAAEKYLKAFLAFQEKHIRKVHDLVVILTLCEEIDQSFKDLRDDVSYLSKFYIETRYPGDYPRFARREASEALKSVLKIKEFVWEKIKNKKERE
ncbi:MAG: HEPN domain-containing protein [bacterium]|nr:HEPN domain-containing protein [bacterium]